MKNMPTLLVLAVVVLAGCARDAVPERVLLLGNPDATIRIVFPEPVPVSYTIPVAKNCGTDARGSVSHRGTKSSGATNDQNLVTVHWELLGRSSWGRGDAYYFDIGDGLTLTNKTQHLVLYTGSLQPVADSDRVSIMIGPKELVEQAESTVPAKAASSTPSTVR
jgi:hypothetical protein